MAKPNAKKKAEAAADGADVSAPTVKAAGADQWAKAVVEGVPPEAASAEPEEAFQDTAVPETVFVDEDIVDAEIVDAEIVDAEIIDDDPVEEADVAVATTDEDAKTGDDPVVADAVEQPTENTGDQAAQPESAPDISVEDLVLDLERVTTERDQYLDASRRLQAEFENYKKQVGKREAEARERANDSLVGELLPVLDAFDGAVASGAEDVAPMRSSFLDALAKHGLERIDPADAPFDPNLHEAVMHDDADDTDGPVVAEVMRAGYVWKGRVLRPAMVRTRG